MGETKMVHFLGDIPGLAEELIRKMILNNSKCSITGRWFKQVKSLLATELEFIEQQPVLFDAELVSHHDIVLYFQFSSGGSSVVEEINFGCDVILITDKLVETEHSSDDVKVIQLQDMISYSSIESISNEQLDHYLQGCLSNKGYSKFTSEKFWWVSQQDVAACLEKLVANELDIPNQLFLCGRRGWTGQDTFQQLEMLYQRTKAGASGRFETNHLAPKPVINPVLQDVSSVKQAMRPDLSAINEALVAIDGEGWRPITPLRTSLMHYLAAKEANYSV